MDSSEGFDIEVLVDALTLGQDPNSALALAAAEAKQQSIEAEKVEAQLQIVETSEEISSGSNGSVPEI